MDLVTSQEYSTLSDEEDRNRLDWIDADTRRIEKEENERIRALAGQYKASLLEY